MGNLLFAFFVLVTFVWFVMMVHALVNVALLYLERRAARGVRRPA
jgi:hypothetical protein